MPSGVYSKRREAEIAFYAKAGCRVKASLAHAEVSLYPQGREQPDA
jgi:hypothetical protein